MVLNIIFEVNALTIYPSSLDSVNHLPCIQCSFHFPLSKIFPNDFISWFSLLGYYLWPQISLPSNTSWCWSYLVSVFQVFTLSSFFLERHFLKCLLETCNQGSCWCVLDISYLAGQYRFLLSCCCWALRLTLLSTHVA